MHFLLNGATFPKRNTCLRHGCMGRRVMLSALQHADGRKMKVSGRHSGYSWWR